MATFDTFDVVVVPFPFTDMPHAKRRPALILSDGETFGRPAGHSVMAMITSFRNSPWPLDISLLDIEAAGLSAPSVVRMKLFTLDHRLVIRRAGNLANQDRRAVIEVLRTLFPWTTMTS